MQFLYNDLTEKIIIAYYRVYDFFLNHPGYEENNLRDALKIEMENMGLQVSAEVPVGRAYAGHSVGNGSIDLLVENKVALELKLKARIDRDATDQLDTYLRDAYLAVGLVLKFNRSGPEIKRRFNRAAAPSEDPA